MIYVHDRQDDILITPKVIKAFVRNHGLNKELRQKHLLAFSIGTVITGFFAQWNMGLGAAGPYGMFIAMMLALAFYLTFFRVLGRFSANFPYSGGPYAYVRQGLGTFGGYLAGVATTVQFIAAAALILIIVREYFSAVYPGLPGNYLALAFFALLLAAHSAGIWISAMLQIFLTSSALSGAILFFIGSSQAVDIRHILPAPMIIDGWQGVLAALPAVIWFFLGLEGITMSAEESRKPQRDLPVSLTAGLGFAAIMSLGVLYFGVGSVPWPLLVNVDFPLLFILSKVQSQDKILLTTFSVIYLSAFFSSLHGLINGYSRQVYALSRAGYFPHFLSRMRSNQTPYPAILTPGLISVAVSYIGAFQTITILTLFCAMFMYQTVIISYLRIRKSKPELFCEGKMLDHPFILWMNIIFLIIVQVVLVYYNLSAAWIVPAIWSAAVAYYYFFARKHIRSEAPEESAAVSIQNKVRIEFK